MARTHGQRSARQASPARRRRLVLGEAAASQALTFLIAFAVFVPAFALLILFTRDQGDTTHAREADLDSKSRLGIDLIVGQSGSVSGTAASNWEDLDQPHTLARVGLRDETRNALDYDKILRIQGGELASNATDGKLNYGEFKDALGLGAKYDFHLRAYPIFRADSANKYGTGDLPPIRVAYVGDYEQGSWNVLTGSATPRTVNGTQAAPLEIPALDGLNVGFRPVPYRPEILPLGLTLIDGDVYPDLTDDIDGLPGQQPYLATALFDSGRLSMYEVLIVGSEVEQNLFDALAHKAALRAYVEGGGVIFVLGSDEMTPSWMNGNLLQYNAGQNKKYSGPLTTPDDSHAILTTPNKLDYQGYAFATKRWVLDEREQYTVVIGQSNKNPTDLGVSNDGLYPQGGAVFVSNLNVYELPLEERFKVLANKLVYVFLRSLFIDFGPELDPHSLARSASRILSIETKAGTLIDAKILLYVWRAG